MRRCKTSRSAPVAATLLQLQPRLEQVLLPLEPCALSLQELQAACHTPAHAPSLLFTVPPQQQLLSCVCAAHHSLSGGPWPWPLPGAWHEHVSGSLWACG